MEIKSGKGTLVDIRKIKVLAGRGRKSFEGIPELAESIGKFGLIHPPVVKLASDGTMTLIAGERRFRACLMLGAKEMPVLTREMLSEVEQKEMELEENIQRKDLTWQEKIELLRQVDDVKRAVHGSKMQGSSCGDGWSIEKTAGLVGETKQSVARQISLAKVFIARPDLKMRTQELPMTAAQREIERILEGEKQERLRASGQIKTYVDIQLGSALSLIKKVGDSSVGLILTDPPFGIQELEDSRGESRGTVQTYTTVLTREDNSTEEEVVKLFQDICPELYRVLKPGGHFYIFFAYDCYGEIKSTLESAGLVVNPVPLTWYKKRTTSPFRGYDYSPCSEPLFFGYKPPRIRRLAEASRSLLEFEIVPTEKKVHPFEKPMELIKFLIRQSTTENEVVLDPFVGSGTTVLAAKKLGRTGLGFELNEQRWKDAQARLQKEG
jgi:DNA modification methylase